uniref:Protein FAR1-RELATED SEQUENCE n=1 Tax=Aegilops tauschii subsp. strangulata TaxID=200361 RepID=A0A453S394_AEGTS
MECHSELSKAPPLTICDVQSDAESAIHTRPSSENVFTTPQKMYSAPFCRSSCTPECDDDIRPAIGMTFTDLNAAKDFYEAYAHHVGFSVRVGQHKTANGVITHKRFYCDREGFRQEQKVLEEQRHKELQEDHLSLHTMPVLKTSWAIEKHGSEVFTHEVFEDFQHELLIGIIALLR